MIFSFFFFSLSFFFIIDNFRFFLEWEISFLKGTNLVLSVFFDPIRLIFLGIVRLISSCIIKYSFYYIEGDKNYLRFIFILLFFILSIWVIIIRSNLIRLLLGWDGLGLTSYVLVIYYQNEYSANAGILTVLRNRVGDRAILCRIGLRVVIGGWNFFFIDKIRFYMCILIIIAGITKRAQIPFSAWLPAAIAAPTPVSALVHSSTLVTAGVYILIRIRFLFVGTIIRIFLALLGIITIIISGLRANFESDLKKIIALSTLSQLGLIIIILRLGLPDLAFFHLTTHALFKSALFICVGFIIHRRESRQDTRLIRRFFLKRPLLRVILIITNISLIGFPFLAGFYSKDLILEYSFMNYKNIIVIFIILIATGFTLSYRLRIIFLSLGPQSLFKNSLYRRDINKELLKSFQSLIILRVLGGFLVSWNFFSNRLIINLRFFEKYLIIFVSLILGFIFINISINFQTKIITKKNIIYYRFYHLWFIPYLSTKIVTIQPFNERELSYKNIDLGWYEYWGASGVYIFIYKIRLILQKSQWIKIYRAQIVIGGVLVRLLRFFFY